MDVIVTGAIAQLVADNGFDRLMLTMPTAVVYVLLFSVLNVGIALSGTLWSSRVNVVGLFYTIYVLQWFIGLVPFLLVILLVANNGDWSAVGYFAFQAAMVVFCLYYQNRLMAVMLRNAANQSVVGARDMWL